MESVKNSLILLIKTPPPVTGATQMNQYVCENPYLKWFEVKIIKLQYNKEYKEIGKNPLLKLSKVCFYAFTLIKSIIKRPPVFVYFQISPLGIAFYRDLIYVIIIKLFKVKILYHIHGKNIYEVSEKSKLLKMLYRVVFFNEYIICLSDIVKDDLKNVYDGEPYIVNNGIPKTIIHKKTGKNKVPVLLFISNISKQKGIFDFIDICHKLNGQKQEFKAKIIGDTKSITANDLKILINKYELEDCVQYLGSKYFDEKTKEYLTSDILIHPTYNDAFPLVILEAMEASLPVVSTNEGSIPLIVKDEINGFICQKGSIDCITEKVRILLNDESLRIKMGEAGRKLFLSCYTIENFHNNLFSVFSDVVRKIKQND